MKLTKSLIAAIALSGAAIFGGSQTACAQQQEMSFKEAMKAAKEARKAMKENPDEAKKYMDATLKQAKEQLEMNKAEVDVAGVTNSQAQQGQLGAEYKAGEAAARKAADARFAATPLEILCPTGEGFTTGGTKKRPTSEYNGVRYAMPESGFTPGTKTVIDWAKGVANVPDKWTFKGREMGSGFQVAPTVTAKWQGKRALSMKTCEFEPDLGTEYLPENCSIEFDVWSTPSTANMPQDYADNFLGLTIWGDVNKKIFELYFSPNTLGPHGYINEWEMSFENAQLHSATSCEWEFPADLVKPNSWTHIAISLNERDLSVYVNGRCMASYNRAYLYGSPRILWLHTEFFRNKPTYIANFKVMGY